ncbi:hypothetical protein MMC12_003080 [Toensbergia leucococca]|nr:hypothetical protein [Toensbergia leucococca]
MPPKKSKATKAGANSDQNGHQDPSIATEDDLQNNGTQKNEPEATSSSSATVPSKRKRQTTDAPSKAPRRSARGAQPTPTDQVKTLQFLLSPSALDLCRPHDEVEDLKARGPDLRTYSSSAFSPFEELVCAVVLSRPISHALGLRTIRTILNKPYDFCTPGKIRGAGHERRRKALDEARTQHRQKTAEELGILADAVVDVLGDGEEDVSLERVRRESGYDVEKEREMLQKNIKGLGKTGLDIFFRRMQGVWPKSYPFADQRTLAAAEKLGLPNTAKGLRILIDENWEKLETGDINAGDEEEKRRKAFVRVLERAVGADLEKKVDQVKAEAEAS